ncbi:MAG: DUF1674 domain-containing protein [Sphingopyxis sp.]
MNNPHTASAPTHTPAAASDAGGDGAAHACETGGADGAAGEPRESAGLSESADIGGTPRALHRPVAFVAPAHWANAGAPPAPAHIPFVERSEKGRPDPVRYGDWENKGIAVDF